jgi:hypothetical protein
MSHEYMVGDRGGGNRGERGRGRGVLGREGRLICCGFEDGATHKW